MATHTDVVIAGAGPTGLLLAGDLAAAGVDTTVLESRAGESNLTRAFALHARSLEQLDARGLADEVIATGRPIPGLRLFDQLTVDLSSLPTRYPYVLITPQYHTEAALERRALHNGARILRGTQVTGLRQDAEGVDVQTAGDTYRARYAVGADGVRSTVREALGLDFPGHATVRSLMLADVRLENAPEGVLAVNSANDCFAFVAPFGDGWYRIFAWDRGNPLPDSAPVDLDEVRSVTRRALGTDFGMHDPRWLSRFHSDERQVRRYRVGRVFLAGDAAHVHTPAGGMGMNTGLQDAANLGWKLAAAVRGDGGDPLLDSYQDERHPVGRMVLRASGALIRLTMIQSRPGRVARNTVGGAALRIGPIARKVSGMLSGIGIGYPAPGGADHSAGRRAGDIALAGDKSQPIRLYEALRGGRFVLVVPPGADPGTTDHRVDVVTAAEPGDQAELVRPDGYLAWAGDPTDRNGIATALGHWYPSRTA
jgi:2-polyprenyl-6-methoxyphenol hydroxylase-like FAD-dependent oxidoreductase